MRTVLTDRTVVTLKMGNRIISSKKASGLGVKTRIQATMPIHYTGGITTNDDSSSIYLTDHTTHQIVHIDLNNSVQRVIIGKKDYSFPWSTKCVNNHLYVTDTFQHSLTMYDTNGNCIHKFGSKSVVSRFLKSIDIDVTSLNNPREIATDQRGRIYVCDNGNSRILIITPDMYLITFVEVPYPSDVIVKDDELLVYSNERCAVSVVNETQRKLGNVENYPLGFRKMNLFYIERFGRDRDGNLLFFDATGGQILVVDEITFRLVKRVVDSKTQYLNYMQKHSREDKVAVLFKERDESGNNSIYFRFIQL